LVKGMETLSEGAVFGRLKVVTNVGGRFWLCRCICGNTTTVPKHRLLAGVTKSCGCLKRNVLGDSVRKHGMANSKASGYKFRIYGIWQAMRDRCTNANRKDFMYYGGRGIKVCEAWQVFEKFYEDMGDVPEGATLDSRKVKHIHIKGETKTLKEWLEIYGIPKHTYYTRRKKGMSEIEAIIN
jgi:hypothetical protein